MSKVVPNIQNLKTWRDALLSGKYTQCSEKLVDVNREGVKSHCCIGVAGELCGITFDDLEKHSIQSLGEHIYNEVADWLGLTKFQMDNDSDENKLSYIEHFVHLNDYLDKNFKQIAKEVDKLIKREEAKLAKTTSKVLDSDESS